MILSFIDNTNNQEKIMPIVTQCQNRLSLLENRQEEESMDNNFQLDRPRIGSDQVLKSEMEGLQQNFF